MGQRLKRSSLFFGQVAGGQKPEQYKDTLSGFYGGVGAGQTGAVETLGQKVQEKTQGLAGTLGLTQTVDEQQPTKVTTTLAEDSQFRPSVDTSKPIPSAVAGGAATPLPATTVTIPDKGTMSDEDYLATLEKTFKDAGTSVEEWKASGKSAQDYLDKVLKDKQEAAGKAATEAQEQVTEKKLGARREASELEKQASMYQNVLATSPGTTNVEALASLSRFFDPKYATLESGLRQGEMSLARQEAIGNVAAQQQAEQARAAAIGEYSKQAKELGRTLQEQVGKAGEAERQRLSEFYGKGLTEAEKTKADIEGRIGKTKGDIESRDQGEFEKVSGEVSKDPTYGGLKNIIDAINGRAGDNWLRTQGNKVLEPIKQEMLSLVDEANQISANPNISTKERTARLNEVKGKIKAVRSKVAGQLAAFLGDTNTQPGDALDAAEQIMAGGFIDDLSPEQKAVIIARIEKQPHINTFDKNNLSSPEKLAKIYKAFGGAISERDLIRAAYIKQNRIYGDAVAPIPKEYQDNSEQYKTYESEKSRLRRTGYTGTL